MPSAWPQMEDMPCQLVTSRDERMVEVIGCLSCHPELGHSRHAATRENHQAATRNSEPIDGSHDPCLAVRCTSRRRSSWCCSGRCDGVGALVQWLGGA
jgi:hypothetical protein